MAISPSEEVIEADAWLSISKMVMPLQKIRMNMRGAAKNSSAIILITFFMEFVIIYPLRYPMSK